MDLGTSLLVAFAVLIGGAAAVSLHLAGRHRRDRLRALVAATGLEVRSPPRSDSVELHGRYDGLSVVVRIVAGSEADLTCVTVRTGPAIGRRWQITHAAAVEADAGVRRVFEARVATGDTDFDAAVHVDGPALEVAAALSAAVRRSVEGFLAQEDDAALRDGALVVRRPGRLAAAGVVTLLDQMVALVRQLTGPSEAALADRLAQNAFEDPVLAVRLANRRLLLEHPAAAPFAVDLARRSLTSKNEDVRDLATLSVADPDSEAALLTLLGRSDEAIRCAAVRALAEHGSERALAALHDLTRDPDTAVRRAVVEAIARVRERHKETRGGAT